MTAYNLSAEARRLNSLARNAQRALDAAQAAYWLAQTHDTTEAANAHAERHAEARAAIDTLAEAAAELSYWLTYPTYSQSSTPPVAPHWSDPIIVSV